MSDEEKEKQVSVFLLSPAFYDHLSLKPAQLQASGIGLAVAIVYVQKILAMDFLCPIQGACTAGTTPEYCYFLNGEINDCHKIRILSEFKTRTRSPGSVQYHPGHYSKRFGCRDG
jgi:hypothetical protein